MGRNSLVDKLLESSQNIQSSLRGSGNYITINRTISDIIHKIERKRIRKDKINKLFNV